MPKAFCFMGQGALQFRFQVFILSELIEDR
jgi:hypothetical protein